MRTRRRFRPALDAALEPRLVMSGGLAGNVPAQVVRFRREPSPPVPRTVKGQIISAFANFTEQYEATRESYETGLSDADPASQDSIAERQALVLYLGRRVELLAQKVSGDLLRLQLAGGSGHGKDKGNSSASVGRLPGFVSRKLNAVNDEGRPLPGTLLRSLTDAIPPAGSTEGTIALLNQSADIAIIASRQSFLNGVALLRSSNSGGKSRN